EPLAVRRNVGGGCLLGAWNRGGRRVVARLGPQLPHPRRDEGAAYRMVDPSGVTSAKPVRSGTWSAPSSSAYLDTGAAGVPRIQPHRAATVITTAMAPSAKVLRRPTGGVSVVPSRRAIPSP